MPIRKRLLTQRQCPIPLRNSRAPHFSAASVLPVIRQNLMHSQNEWLGDQLDAGFCGKILVIISLFRHFLGGILIAFGSRNDVSSPSARFSALHTFQAFGNSEKS